MTLPMQRTTLNDLKRRPEIAYMIRSSALWDIGGTPLWKTPTSSFSISVFVQAECQNYGFFLGHIALSQPTLKLMS